MFAILTVFYIGNYKKCVLNSKSSY